MLLAHSRTAYAAAAALLAIAAVAAVATALGSGRRAAAALALRQLGDDIIGFPNNGACRHVPCADGCARNKRHACGAGRL